MVRVAQLLINDAESAIAEANPAQENTGRARAGTVSPTLTVPQKVANSEMRTAAAVWADKREEVEADPEAVVPTRAALIREARQNRQGEAAHLLPPYTTVYHRRCTTDKAILGHGGQGFNRDSGGIWWR